MSNRDFRYLKLATQIAKKTRYNIDKNYYLAAIAIRKDDSFCYAINLKTQVRELTSHAEVRALKKAGHGSTLYVVRILSNDDWANAKPCENCQRFIISKRVKRVIYTINNNEIGTWFP